MSAIYFHSEHGTARLSGSERAYMGVFCSGLLVQALGVERAHGESLRRLRRLLPVDHYVQDGDDESFRRAFSTWLAVGDGTFGVETRVEPFIAALNTAVAVGGDVVKLMARLHAQCEIHAFVEETNRAWLAEIIERGRASHVLRAGMGWDAVVELLRSRDDEPVVTSYSVCDSFPSAQLVDDVDDDAFYELPGAEKWSRSLAALRAKEGGFEMKPDDWGTFYFGNGASGFTVAAELDALR